MGSMDCFLRGEKNLKWIEGVIRASGLRKEALQKLFAIYHENYFVKPSFQELKEMQRAWLHLAINISYPTTSKINPLVRQKVAKLIPRFK